MVVIKVSHRFIKTFKSYLWQCYCLSIMNFAQNLSINIIIIIIWVYLFLVSRIYNKLQTDFLHDSYLTRNRTDINLRSWGVVEQKSGAWQKEKKKQFSTYSCRWYVVYVGDWDQEYKKLRCTSTLVLACIYISCV